MKTTWELTFIGQILHIYLADHSQKQKKCHSPKRSLECKQKLSHSKLTAKSKSQNETRCPSMYFPAIKSFQYIYQTFLLWLEFHIPVFFNPSFLRTLFWILIPLSTQILCCPRRNAACLTRAAKWFLAHSRNNTALFLPFFSWIAFTKVIKKNICCPTPKESYSIKENANRHIATLLRLQKLPHSVCFTFICMHSLM